MKKTFLHAFLICVCCTYSIQNFAQQVSRQKTENLYQPSPMLADNAILQKVYTAFSKINEVKQLDLSQAKSTASSFYENKLQTALTQKDVLKLSNKTVLQTLVQERPEALSLKIPFNNQEIILDLARVNFFADDYKVLTDKHPEGIAVEQGAFYQGVVRGENSIAAISVFSDAIEGLISAKDGNTISIEKLIGDNSENIHVVYGQDAVINKASFNCGAKEPADSYLKNQAAALLNNNTAAAVSKCVNNYWETCYNIFQWQGSTQNVSNYVTSLFNNFATIYNRESITMKLKTTYIWTSPDNYAGNDNLQTLNNFSSRRTGFGADLAALLSTTGGGGVAYIDGICSSEYYRHSFSGSLGSFSSFPGYSWAVNCTTHEVGHNLGSPHTHSCSWVGGAIDGCGPAANPAYSEGCNGPLPTRGTIMSYCHLVNGIGVDFNLGFGSQPGNLIRSHVNNCVSNTCSTTGSCTAPQGLTATAVSTTSEQISWSASGANSYTVYYKPSTASSWTVAATGLTSTSYTLNGLSANTSYNVNVYSNCADGTSPLSGVNFTTGSANTCVAPQNVTSTSISSSSQKLTWTASSATSYYIYYKPSYSSTWTLAVQGLTSPTYTFNGLSASTTYNVDIYAVCSNGTYPMTSTSFTTSSGSSCPAPQNVWATSISPGTEKLTWSAFGASSYYIYYKPSYYSNWTLAVQGLTSPSYTFTGLYTNTVYNADIYAVCPNGTYPVTRIDFMNVVNSPAGTTISQTKDLMVQPNPATTECTITFNVAESKEAKLTVVSAQGAVLIDKTIPVKTGPNNYRLNISGLTAGTYFIHLNQNGKRSSTTFIKQ